MIWFDLIYLVLAINLNAASAENYQNIWAVKIDGDVYRAKDVARRNDFEFVRKASFLDGFDNIYIFRRKDLPEHHRMKRQILQQNDSSIIWLEQQRSAIRVKRSILPTSFESNRPGLNDKLRNLWDTTQQFMFSFGLNQNKLLHRFNDELWPSQWHIHSSGFSRFDHGITRVWDMGFTGKGIVVTILDDGLEWNHSDLHANYDHNASYDMNDDDPDPTPRYDLFNSNSHGTRCAGVVSMIPQNKKCGVGAAYHARIGGIRCLDGDVSDIVEANSLAFRNEYIDIYSASWGPSDDGMTLDGPKMLAQMALERGITHGRKGKGNIYVWASGNGGSRGDNCNCDGYVSSIYTISINSVSESGRFPWYAEKCSSTLAAAFSSGAFSDKKIATTDIHNTCTREHSGTSAAAPLAAAILALVLEANPNLTWRDVQHLIVCTSEFSPLLDERGWRQNGAGFLYNSRFGFGLLMAESLVRMAIRWDPVPEKYICVVQAKQLFLQQISTNGDMIRVYFLNQGDCSIEFLEHVQVKITLETTKRGNTRMFMFSPKDTLSVLMYPRNKDNSMEGFHDWNLTSVHYWGEKPVGLWRLYIQNRCE
ncbi:proprotein convertase subtilisin/kexin-like protein [Euroglyphus maynei]|uniref:furin n=1 Tax=Euroglyphus maynei TaxID=6958 RepID=A0A1Y3BT07_EURMA|nr:proprotein convertase subtilisin/kexin-like protein [Euroglyphus maynei]